MSALLGWGGATARENEAFNNTINAIKANAPKFGEGKKGAATTEGEGNNNNEEGKPAAKENTTPTEEVNNGEGDLYSEPAPTIEELIAKANEAYLAAKAEYEALGQEYIKKTVASDDIKTVSGWSEKPTGYSDISPEAVKTHAEEIGHEPKNAGAMDQKSKGGFDGKYNCSHSEKQIWTAKPNEPIGSSREVCTDCQNFGSKQAVATGKPNVVADPEGTYIFHPDGTTTFIPR